jgi:hypothetical protein
MPASTTQNNRSFWNNEWNELMREKDEFITKTTHPLILKKISQEIFYGEIP